MSRQGMSLRWVLVAATLLVLGLALLIVGSLHWLTTERDKATGVFDDGMENIEFGQALQADLLTDALTTEPGARLRAEKDLAERFAAAKRILDTAEEQQTFQQLQERVLAFLARREQLERLGFSGAQVLKGSTPALDGVVEATNEFTRVNLDQVRESRARVNDHWRIANLLIGGSILAYLCSIVALVVWLGFFSFRPVVQLDSAMERFGRGDDTARAPLAGPAEVRQMALRFNEMADALQQQQQRRLTFLAGIAHDLRNPLAALQLALSAVGPDRPLPPEPRLRGLLQVLRRQIRRMAGMTDDLLDTVRVQSGRLRLRLERCELGALAREAIELFAPSDAERLHLELPDEPVLVRCDPGRIDQVLINLLSNALKFSSTAAAVKVKVWSEDGEAVVSVEDQGVGISPEDQRRLFEPFRRLGSAPETFPGMGLGLFVARRIVEAHGGQLEAQSVLGSGTTFLLRLPVAGVPAEKELPEESMPPSTPSPSAHP